jgi:PhnB protein
MTVKSVPEGHHSASAFLIVKDAVAAIAFYTEVFGAQEILRFDIPGGGVAHAELRIGDSVVMLADEAPPEGSVSPETLGGTAVRMHLYVEDVDAVMKAAVAAHATVLIPPADQFYGDRSGRLRDPFGHLWIVSTHKEDVAPAEMVRRFRDLMKG